MLFPELVRHWRFVQNVEKTIGNLVEAGATALTVGQIAEVRNAAKFKFTVSKKTP